MSAPKYLLALTFSAPGLFYASSQGFAAPILDLDLASFAVLGAAGVTNVPTSTIGGNLGSAPNASVGSGYTFTSGSPQANTPLAQSAQTQLTTARNNLGSLGPGTLLAADLAGLTLFPGVYTVPAGTTNLSGPLTLDGQGNADAAWVFQMPSTLITSPNSVVNMIHTGSGAGVYWNVGSSATIDTNTTFLGNILALASITMNTTATDLCGRALAETGQVTLDQNSLSGICTGILADSSGLSGGLDVTTTPGGATKVVFLQAPVAGGGAVSEPATLALMGLAFAGIGWGRWRNPHLHARQR